MCSRLVSVIGASPPAYAWGWDDIIKPGSHIIDLKRLADSVQETLQMVETLRNEVKKLQNQIQAMRKIELYPREMEAAIKNALQFPDMKTIFDFGIPTSRWKTSIMKQWMRIKRASIQPLSCTPTIPLKTLSSKTSLQRLSRIRQSGKNYQLPLQRVRMTVC